MANPQKEDGYTPVANEILEQVYKLKLNGTQFKVIMVVWRFTYGFSRKEHELSETFIARATETHKAQMMKELSKLISQKILKVMREATFTRPRLISFNKNYNEWITNDLQLVKSLPPIEIDTSTVSELTTSTVSEFTTQDKQYIKQNIKQGNPILFDMFWKEYPKRIAKVAAEKAFAKLKVNDELLETMLLTLENQKQSKQWSDKTYVPYPATWLNQRRWEDEAEQTDTNDRISMTADGTFKI